jgi:hypothetical protein
MIMQGWPNAKMSGNNKILPTAYPVTLCWKSYQDQTPSEISFDSTAYERYADQLGPSPGSPTPDPAPALGVVEPATASHKRGASDVTTRSEREAKHEQERPAWRAVGAQELAGSVLRQLGRVERELVKRDPGSPAQDQGAV